MKPSDLVDPHLLHVFLGHLPIAGLIFGLIALLISLLSRSNPMRVLALGLIIAGALSTWPASQTGERSFKKISETADARGIEWLEEHANRADRTRFYYYGLAGVAALAMLVRPMQSGLLMLMTTATFIGTVAMIAVGMWIGTTGIGISHKDLRGELKRSSTPVEADTYDKK